MRRSRLCYGARAHGVAASIPLDLWPPEAGDTAAMPTNEPVAQPRLVLLCGLPGSGKTTLGRRVEIEYSAVRLCPDDWLNGLGIDLNEEATRERLEALLWTLAQRLLELGRNVILESGFWLRSDRDEKRLGARALGAAVELRYLDVPIAEIQRRLAARTALASPGHRADNPRADRELDPALRDARSGGTGPL